MKRIAIVSFLFILSSTTFLSCTDKNNTVYSPADGPLLTQWTEAIGPDNAWQEYPRPQLVREAWINLNGLWSFAITAKDSMPDGYDHQILVPFPVESALSGIGQRVDANQKLWYRREVSIPGSWRDRKVLLHIEAADWETTLWVDDERVGSHRGGYDPFTFDLSEHVSPGSTHLLTLVVWDPTDQGFQPRGKQVSEPRGIWYTPSSGIWQTVWMEPVAETYMEDLRLVTDIDRGMLLIDPLVKNGTPEMKLEVSVLKNGEKIAGGLYGLDEQMVVRVPEPTLWDPGHPFLYDLHAELSVSGQVVDVVDSYFGMRKISVVKDENGFNRLALNNEVLFQNGPLDQGFWPDGLYTPPSDVAMRHDIEMTRAMGFNMLRKHVKVENRRYYSHCDRMGMLVWQDMPSASGFIAPDGDDLQPSADHREQFEKELIRMISTHVNHPSIVMWVPFNEGWGQYDTERIVELIGSLDSTRLVNNASGWTDRGIGDVIDIHHYPDPRCPEQEKDRASVLGEFGGLGLYVEGHVWQEENWGYEKMEEVDELLLKYEDYYRQVREMETSCGLAAVVYTQTTDVETETNGLMTYDRDRVKMGVENIRMAHLGITPPVLRSPIRQFIDSLVVELRPTADGARLQYCLCVPGMDDRWTDYHNPITIREPLTMKTRSLWDDGRQSRENSDRFTQVSPFPALHVDAAPGLQVRYFRGNWLKLPDFSQLQPVSQATATGVGLETADTTALFGLVFEGYLQVPETDVYLFHLSSDDGARMYLNREEFIDYDGIHGPGIRKRSIALEKGLHPFRLVYFQRYGGRGLTLSWESNRIPLTEIGPENWKH